MVACSNLLSGQELGQKSFQGLQQVLSRSGPRPAGSLCVVVCTSGLHVLHEAELHSVCVHGCHPNLQCLIVGQAGAWQFSKQDRARAAGSDWQEY